MIQTQNLFWVERGREARNKGGGGGGALVETRDPNLTQSEVSECPL